MPKKEKEESVIVSEKKKEIDLYEFGKPIRLVRKHNPLIDDDVYVRINNYLAVHNINTDNFINTAFNEIRKNKELSKCLIENPDSINNALYFAAEIGLYISESIGDLYLLLDKVNIEGKEKTILKPQIGYKGFITLLYRAGIVKNLWAHCVYDNDEFVYELGLEPKIKHTPDLSRTFTSSKDITHVYAVCKLANDETQFVVINREQVVSVSNLNKSNNKMYFNDTLDPNHWMIKKIAIKQLAKLIPKDYYTKKALEFDNAFESGAYLEMDSQTYQLKIVENKPSKKKSGIYDFWD